jgi:hypothetical protein
LQGFDLVRRNRTRSLIEGRFSLFKGRLIESVIVKAPNLFLVHPDIPFVRPQ